ncbi:MAG TPA: glycerol-3-phosphate acyltransferase [Verrucomicrobiae bacterium]|nr:glycerol-3-phosphate acyltransferase [Verrucomicrobiae bacterium]
MHAWIGQADWLLGAVVVLAAYFIGCFSTGYYLVRARTGEDIRALGTGSCGARNVSRVLGSSGFAYTLAGDLAKGGVAVWLAQTLTPDSRVALLALVAAVAGHVWPIQLAFQGGKGIATSLAGLLLYDCWMTLIYLTLFGALFSLTRRSVASSLGAYALLPLASFLAKQDAAHVCGITVLAVFIFIAHHQNIVAGARSALSRRGLAEVNYE